MESESSYLSKINLTLIIIAVIVVFILPYGYQIDLGPGPNSFLSITWEFSERDGLMILAALEYFIYYLYRLVVLRAVWRFLNDTMSSKRLLSHGLVSEAIHILITIPAALFLSDDGENYLPIMIPIPFLLIYCMILFLYAMKRKTT